MALVNNFVGSTAKSDLAKLGRATTDNMFIETASNDYGAQTILRGMPGFQTVYSVTGNARGIHKAANGKLFYASGNKLYCNGAAITTISGTSPVSMCETGGHKPYLMCADGTTLFAIDTTLEIADMPANILTIEVPNDPWESTESTPVPGKPVGITMIYDIPMLLLANTDRVYMGYQYPWEVDYGTEYSGEKVINNFNKNDIFMLHWQDSEGEELFPEGKWISIDFKSDIANSITTSSGSLIVGGPKSVQKYSYVGGDFVYSEVFSCQQSSCYQVGTFSKGLIDIAGHCCFVGDDGVFVDWSKVSDDFVMRAIKGKYVAVSKLKWYSHDLFIIHLTDQTLAYDISNGSWINLSTINDGVLGKWRYEFSDQEYCLCNGALCQLTETTYQDYDGSPIVKRRRGGLLMREGKEMQIDEIRFLDNSGQYDGNATLKVYTDGILTQTELLNLSDVGDYGTPLRFYDLGCGRYFEVELLCDTNSKFGIYGMDVVAQECLC